MAGNRNFKHSNSKGLTDAIFEGLLGGLIKVLSELFFKVGGIIIIIVAVIYFIVKS